ncbi:MAG: tetratricopeptide repeat protein, partial [Pyrinomonadaceae bacterium]
SVQLTTEEISVGALESVGNPPPLTERPHPQPAAANALSTGPVSQTAIIDLGTFKTSIPARTTDEPRGLGGSTKFKERPLTVAAVDESKSATVIANTTVAEANEFFKTGSQLLDEGNLLEAIKAYQQSIALQPGSADAYLGLGTAYLRIPKDKDAFKAFQQSTELNPELVEAQYGLGFTSFRLGRPREAADAFKKAIALNFDLPKAHYALALAYQQMGMHNAVISEYKVLQKQDQTLAKQLQRTFPPPTMGMCRLVPLCQ